MKDRIRKELRIASQFVQAFGKWLGIAGVIGVIGGLVGAAFYLSIAGVASLWSQNAWLLWLLPIAGVCIVASYQLTRMQGKSTNTVIDMIHTGERVPLLLAPVIFAATTVTHLCGGSAGREGAALQIGGSLGCNIGGLFRLDDKDMRLATFCGMSAVFAALFGTPLTAAFFALEVVSVGVVHYSGLVPCMTSAIVAYGVTQLFHIAPTHFTISALALTGDMLWRVAILAILCALMSIVFCVVMHGVEHVSKKLLPNAYLRVLVGGALLIALTKLLGTTDYNGAGAAVLKSAVEQGVAVPSAFLWKLLFTAITLGVGFKGGEVVPSFFVGATFGCVVGPLLGVPASFAAAIGLVAVFCGAVNCPGASIMLSIELFGSEGLVYFAVACGVSYMLSGYYGLYSSQKIAYSKTKAEYINIQANDSYSSERRD